MNIIIIGNEIHSEDSNVSCEEFSSNVSLHDYDICIFFPNIKEQVALGKLDFNGRRVLNAKQASDYAGSIFHWQREIIEALDAGKNIFVLLNKEESIYTDTGSYSNYRFLPNNVNVLNVRGKSMKLLPSGKSLSQYWNALEKNSEYRVYLNCEDAIPFIETKTGGKSVGGFIKNQNKDNGLILLPYINFENTDLTYFKDGTEFWNKDGVALCKKFIGNIKELNSQFSRTDKKSSTPSWLESKNYKLVKEISIEKELQDLSKTIKKLSEKDNELRKKLENEQGLKDLLYETGEHLEKSVMMALKILGFTTKKFQNHTSEFDVVFESEEGRIIGEVEGKDNKPINIEKFRQLETNIHEDFERDEVSVIAKGALIGNACRLKDPKERGDYFTEKCLQAAKRNKTALIRSLDLFLVAKDILDNNPDDEYLKKCRSAIFSADQIVTFPKLKKNS